MLVIDFFLGMLGGGLVHKFLEKKEADDRSYYEKPEWEEIRKIPGRIFWTIALPLFVMAAVSRDATAIAGWLILICLVMYGIFHFGFSVAGLFLPWGPEGSATAKKRMVRAAKFYLQARTWEKKELVSLRIE